MMRKAYALPYELSPVIFFFVALGQSLQCASILTSPQDFSVALLLYVSYFPLQFFALSALVFYRRRVLTDPRHP